MKNWENWLYGLMSAMIGGAANSVIVILVSPESFNFQEGLPKLGTAAFAFGIVSAALYLKQSPLPCLTPVEVAAVKAAEVVAAKAVETAKTDVAECKDIKEPK